MGPDFNLLKERNIPDKTVLVTQRGYLAICFFVGMMVDEGFFLV